MTNDNDNDVKGDIEEDEKPRVSDIWDALEDYVLNMPYPGPPSERLKQKEMLKDYLGNQYLDDMLDDYMADGMVIKMLIICGCEYPDLDTIRGYRIRMDAKRCRTSDNGITKDMLESELVKQTLRQMVTLAVPFGPAHMQEEYHHRVFRAVTNRKDDTMFGEIFELGVAFNVMRACGCGDSNMARLLGYVDRVRASMQS